MDTVTIIYVDEASAVYVGTELIGVEAFGDLFDDVTAEVLGKRFGFEVEAHDYVGDKAGFDVYDEDAWPKFLPDALRTLSQAKAQPVNKRAEL